MTQLGIAQTAFLKTYGYLPQSFESSSKNPFSEFQFLSNLIEVSLLKEIDLVIAATLIETIKDMSAYQKEAIACFLCHLSLASRLGHLCIKVEQNCIIPDPAMSWFNNAKIKDLVLDSLTLNQQLHAKILIGAHSLPTSLLTKVPEHLKGNSNSNQLQAPLTPIFQSESFFYFQRQWLSESRLFSYFQTLLYMKPLIPLNHLKREAYVNNLLDQGRLLKEQSDAILKSGDNCLSIIFGGPGTGKTYTAGHLIRSYWDSLPEENKPNHEIILAAPTGKAASHLASHIQKAFTGVDNAPKFTFKTLHSLLGINPVLRANMRSIPKIHADLIIVDECSMIDLKIMTLLLSAIKPGARLILLGDPHQLPSIESGTVFTDMIRYINKLNLSSKMPCALSTCLRIEIQGILAFAQVINHGHADEAVRLLNTSSLSEGLYRIQITNKKNVFDIQSALFNKAEEYLPHFSQSDLELKVKQDPMSLLDAFQRFRILTPLRNGPLGVNELNQFFLRQSLKYSHGLHIAPIIITRNDAHLSLFNGEIGVLISKMDLDFRKRTFHKNRESEKIKLQPGDFALFYSLNSQGIQEVRKISALNLNEFEYAYCLSVHKSQGSEFERVLLVVQEGAEVFGREMLYTAVTRAKKELIVYSEDEVLKDMIRKPIFRLSSFNNRNAHD